MTTPITGHPHPSPTAAVPAVAGSRPRHRRPHAAGTGRGAPTGPDRPHAGTAATDARPHPHAGSAARAASGARPRRPHTAARTGTAATAVGITGHPTGAGRFRHPHPPAAADTARTGTAAPAVAVTGHPTGAGARSRHPHPPAAADTARTGTAAPAVAVTGHPTGAGRFRHPHPPAAADTVGTGTGALAATGTGCPRAGSAVPVAGGVRPRRRRAPAARTGTAALAPAVAGSPWGAGVRSRPLAVLITPPPRPAPEHWL
ncbi:hypothetical protein ABZS59_05110 [Streptomyces flaveolus]|uniref:hypothetical protein n=1 Tax=Streptomyces flaveolus TaxID=67297 RepID=UPI0033B55358